MSIVDPVENDTRFNRIRIRNQKFNIADNHKTVLKGEDSSANVAYVDLTEADDLTTEDFFDTE